MKQSHPQIPIIPAAEGISLLRLKILVLVCGAVLMSLEMIGSRIISPYFGNSIYVWGSLISIVLGALSLGYYIGGRLVDKHPSPRLLGAIIATAGVMLLVLRYVAPWVCETIWHLQLGPKFGTLASCTVLFFVPGVLLGTVSPFAVRLAARNVTDMGKTAGILYALSTLGSILGVLVTSFVLIDMMGTSAVVLSLGIVLISTGVLASLTISMPAAVSFVLVPISIIFTPAPPRGVIDPDYNIIFETDSPYQHIIVTEANVIGPDRRTRLRRNLQFDQYIESAVYIDEPGDPIEAATSYTDVMHMPIILNPDIKTVLAIGGGGGTVPREYHDHYGCNVQIVEIDPKVVKAAYDYFFLVPGERMKVTVEDGRMFLKLNKMKYDVIMIDAFSGGGQIPFHLTTKEFFTEVMDHLTPKTGMVAMNIISSLDDTSLYMAIRRTMAEAGIKQIYVFPRYRYRAGKPFFPKGSGNIIVVGTTADVRLPKSEIVRRVDASPWKDMIKVKDLPDIVRTYWVHDEQLDDLTKAMILTDDYAPVELMASE
ncbi:MAG TPA: fused MFS/spermidine synthase [Planctomycetota bacterium]|nr:fused MFS/spermidine synthase [Planctomycetota bacterium]